MTILVVSYDGYSDLWDNFFKCKELYWRDCPYETVLANNKLEYKRDGVRVIHCGSDAQWSTRARTALKSIDSKYVCFLLEDFFISSFVDSSLVEGALNLMEQDSLKYYKLLSFSKIRTPQYKNKFGIKEIPNNLNYGVSLLAAIWEKDYFLEKIGEEDYNPWRFEADRNVESESASSDEKYIDKVYDSRNILNICHMIVQGKYIRRGVHVIAQKGINVDLSKRPVMTISETFSYKLKRFGSPIIRKYPFLRGLLKFVGFNSVEMDNRRK